MFKFGKTSEERLAQAHPDLQRLFRAVITVIDCTIIETHRSAERQVLLLRANKTETLNSYHLPLPSLAVDAVPYPVEWPDQLEKKMREGDRTITPKRVLQSWGRLYLFAGVVYTKAHELGIEVEWGGAWRTHMDPRGNGFQDLAHWQLKRSKGA